MANEGGTLGIGLAGGIISDALGMGIGKVNTDRSVEASKEMADYNKNIALDMFNKTGVEAQLRQIENAGLNAGLMYSKGAGGGTTQSNAGNVQATSGKSEVGQNIGMALSLANMEADKKLKEAQARNLNVDSDKKEGVDTEVGKGTVNKLQKEAEEIASRTGVNVEQAKKILQDINESKSKIEVNEAQKENIETNTDRTKKLIPFEINKSREEIRLLEQNVKAQITRNIYLDKKEKAELDNLIQDVVNKVATINQRNEELDIKTFTEEIKAQYPSLMNTVGRTIDSSINMILDGLGVREKDKERQQKVIKR